jgi:uncharacterized repeat protein (TIGR03803 family)
MLTNTTLSPRVVLFAGLGWLSFYGPAIASTETVVYSFGPAASTSPSVPRGKLTLDSQGNIYGTTEFGGPNKTGTIYELSPTGKLIMLHGAFGPNQYPQAGVTRTANGALLGTTYGSIHANYPGGSVFKLQADGQFNYATLSGSGPGPAAPQSAPIPGGDGNYYATGYGGESSADEGTLFKVTPGLAVSIVHSFSFYDPAGPYPGIGDLVSDHQGNLYGTTRDGSLVTGSQGGSLYRMSLSGQETILYNRYYLYAGFTDDCGPPNAALILDRAGNIYGTTTGGDEPYIGGCVFEFTTAGSFVILHAFKGKSRTHVTPGLALGSGGTLYGTTYTNGDYNKGAVFKLKLNGEFTIIYSFTGGADGSNPNHGPVLDPHGNLFGPTSNGGALGGGVVYKITSPSE